MPGLNTLTGAHLVGLRVDVPQHRVTVTLRTTAGQEIAEYLLVLEGVTDCSFFDEVPDPWDRAVVAQITTEHNDDTLRLDMAFGSDAAGVTVTCAKAVLRRSRNSG